MTDYMKAIKLKLLAEDKTMTELARELEISRWSIYMVANGSHELPKVEAKLQAWMKGETK